MITVALSAGHHPGEKGAEWNGVTEYPLTAEWAREVGNQLLHKTLPDGRLVNVTYAPQTTLPYKVKAINFRTDIKLAVEIHFNSDPAHKGVGSETLYMPGSAAGLKAARTIQNQLWQVVAPDRGAKPGYYQMNPANQADYFLRATNCPAVIIEPTFIHDPNIDLIRVPACVAIARGILLALEVL